MGRRKSDNSPKKAAEELPNGSKTPQKRANGSSTIPAPTTTATPNGTTKYNLRKRRGHDDNDDYNDSAAAVVVTEEKTLSTPSPWKKRRLADATDKTRWRMRNDCSRHTWHYLEDDEEAKEWPQTYADKWYLGLPLVSRSTPACQMRVSPRWKVC